MTIAVRGSNFLRMSLIGSIKRLFDPNRARLEEVDRKLQREQAQRDESGDGAKYRCRVCGRVGPEERFCSACLADTMVLLPNERGGEP